jgi:hypothetical protein
MKLRIAAGISLVLALAACADGRSPTGTHPAAPVEVAPAPPAPGSPGALDAAHRAYLEGDWVALGERVRDVLLDPSSSELVKQNAYELLDKSYEATKGKLPVAYSLPSGYVNLEYGAIKGTMPHGSFSNIWVRGRALDASHLVGLTLRHLPDEAPLLDKASGKGKFELRDDQPGFKDFVLEQREVDALPADGVYAIRLELDDGSSSEAWFVMHGLESSASPVVESPQTSASLADANPLVSWVPFRSPEYALFEDRTMNVWVSRDDAPGWNWSFWTGEPGELGAVRIGAHPGAAQTKLAPGDYWLAVTAGEIRQFGPVRLDRGSQTAMPFHVVP